MSDPLKWVDALLVSADRLSRRIVVHYPHPQFVYTPILFRRFDVFYSPEFRPESHMKYRTYEFSIIDHNGLPVYEEKLESND